MLLSRIKKLFNRKPKARASVSEEHTSERDDALASVPPACG